MPLFMIPQIALSAKPKVAMRALKRTLSCVGPQMSGQGRFIKEYFLAMFTHILSI